jgi:hypothetical protein
MLHEFEKHLSEQVGVRTVMHCFVEQTGVKIDALHLFSNADLS